MRRRYLNLLVPGTILCPACLNILACVGLREYETLCEHVMSPNAEVLPKKPVFQCPNHSCMMNTFGPITWLWDGSRYGSAAINFKLSAETRRQLYEGDFIKDIAWLHNDNAVKSWNWRYDNRARLRKWREQKVKAIKARFAALTTRAT